MVNQNGEKKTVIAKSPLFLAVEKKNIDVIKLLLSVDDIDVNK